MVTGDVPSRVAEVVRTAARGRTIFGGLDEASAEPLTPEMHGWVQDWIGTVELLRLGCDRWFPGRLAPRDWPRVGFDSPSVGTVLTHIRHVEYRLVEIRAWLQEMGLDEVKASGDEMLILFAGEEYGAWRKLGTVAERAASDILVCDPYVAIATLDLLRTSVRPTVAIRILSLARGLDPAVRPYLPRFRSERAGTTEIRVLGEQMPHDRFLVLDDDTVFLSGASLKDAGRRLSAVIQMSPDVGKTISAALASLWSEAVAI